MADYILDIDAKFLQNLKAADDALAKSISHAKMTSAQFVNMVQKSQTLGKNLGNIQAAISKLGSGATVDFSKGIISINTAAMTATDKVNLLTHSMQQLRVKYDELQSSTSRKGMMLKSSANLTDKSSVETALKQAESKLTKNVSPAKAENIRQQVELYKAALKELSKSDEQRTKEAVTEVQKRVNEANKEADSKIKQSERETNAVRKNHEKLQRSLEKKAKSQPMGAQAAIDLAKQANSVEQLKRAYKELEKARNSINPDTKSGQKDIRRLNDEMTNVKKKIDKITSRNKILANSFSGLSSRAGMFSGALNAAFSGYAISRFVSNLVKIHGEFEMINKSLKVLLHSTARAERIWSQITKLALKSPFQIQELATATKQMAAYRIESDKLYEKTKMLADISAGLGVEMSRLILAYGQVKAANYLRGTELRQFSEAGIDMLGQLAAYYTEMEGRAVTAADVFDRISKRMVYFEDVDEILSRITSKGGAFYKMQEEQSDTLRGQLRNLKDEFALMMNEIGESTHGIMMSVIQMIRSILKNWKTVLPWITTIITSFTAFKVAVFALNSGFTIFGTIMFLCGKRLSMYTGQTIKAMLATRALNAALQINPFVLLISVIGAVAAGLMGYSAAAATATGVNREALTGVNSVSKIFREQAEVFERTTSDIMELTDEIKNLEDEQEGLAENDERSLDINERLTSLYSSRRAIMAELANANSDYVKTLDAIINGVEDLIKKENALIERERILKRLRGAEFISGKFDVDKVNEWVSNLSYAEQISTLGKYQFTKDDSKYKEFKKKFEEADDVDLALYEFTLMQLQARFSELSKDIETMTEEELFAEMWALRTEVTDFAKKSKHDKRAVWYDSYTNSIYDIVDAAFATYPGTFELSAGGESQESLLDLADVVTKEFMNAYSVSAEDIIKNKDNIQAEVYRVFEEIISKLEFEDEGARERFRDLLGSAFGFKWPDKDPGLLDWHDRFNGFVIKRRDALSKQSKELVALWDSTVREISSRHTTVEQKKEELDALIKQLEQDIFDYETGSLYMLPGQYEAAKTKLVYAKEARAVLGGEKSKGKKESPYKDTLKAIDEIHKAFKSLEKDFDVDTAKTGAWEKYGASLDTALKKIGKTRDEFVAQFGDLTSEQSVTDALEWLATQAKDLDEKFDIQQHLGQWKWELNLEVEKEEFNNAVKAIDEMFSGYELSIELDKLHVPKDFAKDFFDVDPLSLEDLRKNLYDEESKFDGTDNAKKFEEYLKKIDELETKAQQERLKKYVEYSKAIVGDRAKILLDSFYELEDIEKTFVMTNSLALNKGLINEGTKMAMEIQGKTMSDLLSMSDADLASTWGFTQKQIDKIREFNKELEAQRDLAIEASNRKTQADLDTMDWKALKESDTFTLAMQDLERVSDKALEKMISQITAYKSEWADMPYTEVKEMIEYLNKLEDARLAYYKPDEAIEVARKEMKILGFTGTADAQTKMLDAEARITELNEELSIVEEMERLKSEGATNEVLITELRSRGITDEGEINRLLNAQSKTIKSSIKDEQKITSDAAKFLKLQTKIIQKYKEKEQRIRDIKGCVDKVFEGWDAINELFEDGSMSSEIAEFTKGVSSSVFEALALVQGFKAAKEGIKAGGTEAEMFGYKLNAAMGIIGWIVMAIQLIAKGLKFAFEQHDKALQKQIDAQVEKVERLQDEYEALEKAIEKAYTAVDLGRLTREATENLEDQIEATEKMIALEEDKKKTDEDAIKGWQDDIRGMKESIEELHEETFSTLTDGIMDDVLSATRDFVDAWHDAYEETGDGMKGLEETFTDMLRNMLRQQASMQLISPFIDRYKAWLQEYVNAEGDNTLTTDEARMWAERVRDTFPEVNELLENFFEGTQGLLETGGELSDLEKGIQGMTEDQAEVLAAYWNSCRFMLSNIDTTLTRLANATLNADEASNPVVSALKEQTVMIRAIREMFSSVIDQGGSPHNGAYLKVYMP
jgi:chromosome segregation ATPase